MKLSYIKPALAVLSIFVTILGAQAVFPRMTAVEPATAKAGEEASVAGEYLDKGTVTEIYITDWRVDVNLQILEQAATAIKFRVPRLPAIAGAHHADGTRVIKHIGIKRRHA